MQETAMFIKNERHEHTQTSEWVHSGKKKKRRPITEKKEKTNAHEDGTSLEYLMLAC
jgi:hypothetical protein